MVSCSSSPSPATNSSAWSPLLTTRPRNLIWHWCKGSWTSAPTGVRAATVESSSRFHIHHRLAAKYSHGRTFLVGDAAHVHSLAGGQGMNIGIQDGVAAAAVISQAILHGRTADQDLARYGALRRPIAQGVVTLTHRLTLLVILRNPILCLLRSWLLFLVCSLPFVRTKMTRHLAELD